MILSDQQIEKAIADGEIVIKPYNKDCLGSNSYDVHLGDTIGRYFGCLDAKKETELAMMKIPDEGIVLLPRILYLAATLEYTESHKHVPFLDGKSSTGRLGIRIHATAGKGDVGFCNYWTLEIDVVEPVRVYAGMPIGQLFFHTCGEVRTPYNKKDSAKYNEVSSLPQASAMWRNFVNEENKQP